MNQPCFPDYHPHPISLEAKFMFHPIALMLGTLCLALVTVFVMLRPGTVITGEQTHQSPESTLIADAPPPEDRGTPGSRS